MRGRAERHHGDLLRPDSGEPAGDADVAKLVDDQRDDAANAPKKRDSGKNGGRRATAEGDEEEGEDPHRDERTTGKNDRDRPLGEHETLRSRYLNGRDSKHANCIDTRAVFLDIASTEGTAESALQERAPRLTATHRRPRRVPRQRASRARPQRRRPRRAPRAHSNRARDRAGRPASRDARRKAARRTSPDRPR